MANDFNFDYTDIGSVCSYRGVEFKVSYDTDPLNPREEWDNMSHMACNHRRYRLGDDNGWQELVNYLGKKFPRAKVSEMENIEILDFALKNLKYVRLLRVYEHGGITMSVIDTHGEGGKAYSGGWDYSIVGIIWADEAEIRQWMGWKKITQKRAERAFEIIESEVETYDQYLRGDIYQYTIYDDDGDVDESCSGYYGEKSAFEEVKRIIDNMIAYKTQRFWEVSEHENCAMSTASFC